MNSLLPIIVLSTSISIDHLPAAEIERSYWDCEFAATQWGFDPGEAAMCSEIYETVKTEKFSGDFERLLVWWRENKDRELSWRIKRGGPQPDRPRPDRPRPDRSRPDH